MANHPSAAKRARQNIKRRQRNRAVRTAVRTEIRKLREAIQTGDAAAAKKQLDGAVRLTQKAGAKGVYHARTVSRKVSRLAHAVAALSAPKA